MTERSVPLLNEYKYGLFRRRLLQTLFGGARIRRVPWFIHLIQLVLWVIPLALSAPFIIVDSLEAWNPYFLSLVYGIIIGVVVLVEELVVIFLRCGHRYPVQQKELDDEEDTVEIDSCCGTETIDFIFSSKSILSVVLHPFISGFFSFVATFLLWPSVMQESLPVVAVVFVSLIGWLVLCNAHYSLSTKPAPETAVYRLTDPLQLRFLYRPFYVFLIGGIFILLRLLEVVPSIYFQLLYASLCLLPVGWMMGVLPPLDALFPWIMEQVLTRFLGGSHMATDLRLLIMLIFSVISVTIVIPLSDTPAFLLLTAFGFLLSKDLFNNLKAILFLVVSKHKNRISRLAMSICNQVSSKAYRSYNGIIDICGLAPSYAYLVSFLLDFLKGAVLLSVSFLCVYFTSTLGLTETRELLTKIFSGYVISLFGLVSLNDILQRPYIFGILRNCLYPKLTGSIERYKFKRKRLHYVSVPRMSILLYISPLVMLILIGLSLGTTSMTIWQRIATARLFRKVWQNTLPALHEMTIASILILALPMDNVWISLGLPIQTLILGLLLEILRDFLQKLYFIILSMIGFLWYRKQRTYLSLTILIVTGSLILSPLLLATVLFSSILLAPLLSLFTLPVFILSFPRTQRFWPSLVRHGSTYLKTAETIYYQQAELPITKALHYSISCGAVPSQPGTQLLLRFDNRLALVTVLEARYNCCTINARGLELQETSCHSEEATEIDDMVETLHHPKSTCDKMFNANVLNTLLPLDSVVVETYSDAHNVLTGIIDQPYALQRFSGSLIKILTWVFNKYINSHIIKNNDIQVTQVSAGCGVVEPTTKMPHAWMEDHSEPGIKRDDTLSWSSVSSIVELPPVNPPYEKCMDPLHNYGLVPLDRPGASKILATKVIQSNQEMAKTQRKSNRVFPDNLSSPLHWKQPPFSMLQISKLMEQFPHEWYHNLNGNVSVEFELLSNVVVSCFGLMDVPSQAFIDQLGTPQTSPLDIYRGFCGEFPHSFHRAWMMEEPAIWKCALKSYRYAVKLMYDEGSLGEVENWEELTDYLEEYEQEWCIVSEKEEAWENAILSNTPHLFSLGQDTEKNVYTAHVLSLQDEVVHIGTLNQASLHGIWTDLALELFYLTNDDEERYSIQAHPTLLRNLSVQTAEPPLGYSIYSSGLVTIPSV